MGKVSKKDSIVIFEKLYSEKYKYFLSAEILSLLLGGAGCTLIGVGICAFLYGLAKTNFRDSNLFNGFTILGVILLISALVLYIVFAVISGTEPHEFSDIVDEYLKNEEIKSLDTSNFHSEKRKSLQRNINAAKIFFRVTGEDIITEDGNIDTVTLTYLKQQLQPWLTYKEEVTSQVWKSISSLFLPVVVTLITSIFTTNIGELIDTLRDKTIELYIIMALLFFFQATEFVSKIFNVATNNRASANKKLYKIVEVLLASDSGKQGEDVSNLEEINILNKRNDNSYMPQVSYTFEKKKIEKFSYGKGKKKKKDKIPTKDNGETRDITDNYVK